MQTALQEIEKVQNYSRDEDLAYRRASGLISPNFPDGKGKFYSTTKEGADAVRQIGLRWRSESKDRQRRLNEESAEKIVREVMGEALASTLWDKRNEPRAAWMDIRDRLEARLQQVSRDIEHSFPCHLLKDTSVGPFVVGPVTFWPRLAWISHVEATAGNKPGWADAVRSIWEGKSELPKDKTHVSLEVRSITRYFECPWVVTAQVQGNDIGRSKERGRLAARLAIDALGVMLEHKHALKFRALGDRLSNGMDTTFAQAKGRYWMGQSLDIPGLDGEAGLAPNFVAGTVRYREAAGKAITSFVALSPADKPNLYQRWCDALFWFGEARRDTEGFMALTRYGMSLDILAKGGKAQGITALVAALLAIKADDPFLTDGTSLKKTVERIYNEGRSQFGHGGRPALLEDLPFSRKGADALTMFALERYVLCLEAYGGLDIYADFLHAVPILWLKIKSQQL
jgi:hypothetical protein